ncbi:hypothetical protein HGRIS_007736 [Hohenbuehelia grisea]|uniref:DNA-binding protein RAP1 n=1 Tax=Hohenbuehelia grisea TaxID=104357 RepID=A0ABR3J5R4_9AGAR
MLLRQIFVEQAGEPVRMHIHPSIANLNARAALAQRIMHSGGDPTASEQSARVILADPNTEVFGHLVKTYQGVPNKFIESYLWVKKCVEKGVVVYTPLVYKNPGGRRPGEERTQFTEEDEERLCKWIATKIPFKETGGRTGNRLYQQLCELASDPEYSWVTRHTWQSWRERYKKNSERLDVAIAVIVEQIKPSQGEKGQYGYVRQTEDKPKRPRKKRGPRPSADAPPGSGFITPDDPNKLDEEFVVGSSNGVPGIPGLGQITMPGIAMHPGMLVGPPGMQVMPGMPPMLAHPPPHPEMLYAPGPAPAGSTPVRKSPAEEEMEDGEDGAEWAVRVGNDAPPVWAKRKAPEDELDGEPAQKRNREDQQLGAPIEGALSPEEQQAQLNAHILAIAAAANIVHVVDQGIQDIARDFRFTVAEVQEYYDKCGEMGRTRSRFQRMRELLQAQVPDDD